MNEWLHQVASGYVKLSQVDSGCVKLHQVASGCGRLHQVASGCVSDPSLFIRLDMYEIQYEIQYKIQYEPKSAIYFYFWSF